MGAGLIFRLSYAVFFPAFTFAHLAFSATTVEQRGSSLSRNRSDQDRRRFGLPVSRMDSITNLPVESITATTMVA